MNTLLKNAAKLVLILGTLVPILGTTQENVIRLRPPFKGLTLANPANLEPNEFTIFSNGAVNGEGEIYKRGAFSTIAGTVDSLDAFKVDSSYGTRNAPVEQLYRYYKSSGLRRLLALTLGLNNYDSTIFSHWYWMNDTTGRFAYSDTSLQDTFSQVSYWPSISDSIRIDVDTTGGTRRPEYLIDRNATFFLNCSNYSDIKWKFNPADNHGNVAYGVLVVNDTLLVFERDSLNGGTLPDTLRKRAYEVRYRSAHNQSSTPTIFQAQATTNQDTVYFCRGMFDPIAWDGSQTIRANVLVHGAFTNRLGSSIYRFRDSTQNWEQNQWSGFWGFWRRKSNIKPAQGAADHQRWWTNWFPILLNGKDTLVIDSTIWPDAAGYDTTAYAIVSMPIDEVVFERPLKANRVVGNDNIIIDTSYFSYRTQKMIYTSPLQVLITKGEGYGQRYQVLAVSDDTLYIKPLKHAVTAYQSRIAFIRSRFPITKFILRYKERTMWVSDTIFQNSIYPSRPGQPGYVEPNTQIVVNPNDGEFIQSTWIQGERLVVGKFSKLYEVINRSVETSGENPDIWQVNLLSNSVGCEAPKSVVQRGGIGWFYDWPQGFYQLSDQGLDKISEPIRLMLDSVTASARDRVVGVFYPSKRGDLILWALPLNGSTKCNRVVSYSPSTQAWGTWDLTNTDDVTIASMLVQEGPGDNGELFFGLADSAYLLRYKPDEYVDSLNGADNTAGAGARTNTFAMQIESKRFELPNQRMRWQDGLLSFHSSGTATVNLNLYKNLSSTSQQQIALTVLTGNNSTKKSFSDAVAGNLLGWRITTTSAHALRFSGMDITLAPAGRRFPE